MARETGMFAGNLIERAVSSARWSLPWPSPWIPGPPDPLTILAGLLLALVSLWMAHIWNRRWLGPGLPVLIGLSTALALCFVYSDPERDLLELSLVLLVVAASLPLGWILVRSVGPGLALALVLVLGVGVLAGLGHQWRQLPDSKVFQHLLSRSVGRPAGPPRECRKDRCRRALGAQGALVRAAANGPEDARLELGKVGFCVAGALGGVPRRVATAGGCCGGACRRRPPHARWRFGALLKSVADRRLVPNYELIKEVGERLQSCPLSEALALPTPVLRRWLLVLGPDDAAREELVQWGRRLKDRRATRVAVGPLADGRTFEIWRLARKR